MKGNQKTFEYQGKELVEIEDTRNSSSSKGGVIAGVIALGVGASNAFALTSTDFDTTTAVADIGLAAIAVITLGVLIMGFKGVKSMLH